MANKINVERTYTVTCSDHGWKNEFPPCGWSGTLGAGQLKTANIYVHNDPHPITRDGFICPQCGAFIPLEDVKPSDKPSKIITKRTTWFDKLNR